MIELTEQQRQAVKAEEAPRFVDSETNTAYVLIRAEVYERIAGVVPTAKGPPSAVRRSQEALRRDLPRMLQDRRLFHQWAAYHGDELVGVAASKAALRAECRRRGLRGDEYYIGWIDHTELAEEEELDPPPPHLCRGEAEETPLIP